VTHLPQVAAQADVHWEVQKITDGATTEVQVHRLAQEGRVRAIATMLSASSVTKEAMGQATQLLDNA
jgi:DNA repair protein RecN (Recombination protein N)